MVQTTNVGTQKIDGIILEAYEMVVVAFSVTDHVDKVMFFGKTFLVANVSPDVILGIPFFILSGVDINFLKKEL